VLATLRIVNLGAVDDVVLELDEGLTVLTGETGVGKTLLIEALHLVLGGTDRGVPVRDRERPSRVEALFSDGPDEVVLARERSTGGRLRATIDGATASAASLSERAAALCELHGQHEHQVLRAAGAARALLDQSGGIDDGEVRRLRATVAELTRARDRLGGDADQRARRMEIAAHEAAEIDALEPTGPDEVEQLLEEAGSAAAVIEGRDALRSALSLIADEGDDPSAQGMLAAARAAIPRAMEARRAEVTVLAERVGELAAGLRADMEAVEGDPERLETLEARIASLQALVRKHGRTLADVLARREALALELDQLRADEARSGTLDRELRAATVALAAAEAATARARAETGAALGVEVCARLGPLALPRARFDVVVSGPAGEHVTFRFAGSGAFEPSPLAEAASGGELSRVMLALTLATQAAASCVVFDEVDAGVGGVTARALAACLAELATRRQVLVVTHLATVAVAAAHHLVVSAPERPDGPARVAGVTGDARVAEIARMLAGDPEDPVAREHATSLLAGDPAVA